ncbi:LPXTG cell wall anchor domain-containing protein, partial [Streptomyces sp. NPDC052676]
LADTGTDAILPAAAGAAALVLGGAALRRRFRPGGSR